MIPTGFEPHTRRSPVTDAWQPLLARISGAAVELGVVIAERHCNGRGFVHGGVVAALTDNAMGLSIVQEARRRGGAQAASTSAVTVGLAVDYLANGKIGQWLQISPRLLKVGKSLGFVDAIVTADGEPIARANATFRLIA